MSARIMVEMTHVRPVFDGKWHMTRLSRMPEPGEEITTYCGQTREASYRDQESQATVKACWDCDLAYRKAHSIPWYGTVAHPALQGRRDHG
jgi:hypothetical protein